MDIRIPQPAYQVAVMLRAAGYVPFQDPNTGEQSFVRRLGANFYPRFHVYVTENTDDVLALTLHLDQKQPSYAGTRAHSGEYSGEHVQEEADRILRRIPRG